MLSLEAYRVATTAPPTGCQCHTDRPANPEPPQFAAEATVRKTPSIDVPPDPPASIEPLVWLAMVHAATNALTVAADRLEAAKRRTHNRGRRPSRYCAGCAGDASSNAFTRLAGFIVTDLAGTVRMTTLNEQHAERVAQDKADSLQRDMVVLRVPAFIAGKAEATREVLIRPRR